MLYCVILAGGSGTRLWPLSRRKSPKQAIPLPAGASLFERTVARLDGLVPPERIFVITNTGLAEVLAKLAPQLPKRNIICEPIGRDSAAAVFLGASIVAHEDKDAVILVSAADHLITPVDRFQSAVATAVKAAGKGLLVTFGIRPTRPSTAYGYIERRGKVRGFDAVYIVRKFHEKPDAKTARRYIRSKRYFWNSGLFVWKASAILDAAAKFAPVHYGVISAAGGLFDTPAFADALAAAYEELPTISIDYAVMEKADNVAMVEAEFDWSDVGSPVALRCCMKPDEGGNVSMGLVDLLESSDCVAISGDDRLLAVFGCKDLVVIQTPDATLVCPAERADELKKLVSRLAARPDAAKFL